MLRTVLGVVAGIVAWIALVIASDFAISAVWPAYQAAKPNMSFDLAMMLARLTESTVALVIAAWIASRAAPASRQAGWGLGIVLLLCFIPIHYGLWNKFPVWYHAYFLASLVAVPSIVATVGRETAAA